MKINDVKAYNAFTTGINEQKGRIPKIKWRNKIFKKFKEVIK